MKSFKTRADFRTWLAQHHGSEKELMIRLFKTHARQRGMGYREALDEALCWGWIDGVRKAHDADSFLQRFTPRKAKSVWSAVNVKRFRELAAEGSVAAPGLAAFRAWDGKPAPYSFEATPKELAPELLKPFQAKKRAWAFWAEQPAGYRRVMTHWVMSAKRAETRKSRLAALIAASSRGERVNALKPPKGRRTP